MEIEIQTRDGIAKGVLIVESENDIFYAYHKGQQKVIVYKGARIKPVLKNPNKETDAWQQDILNRREEKSKQGIIKDNVFLKDCEFDTLNSAGEFVYGNYVYGTEYWCVNENGNMISLNKKYKTNTHYWLFSPGDNASLWEEFYKNNIMGIGWDEVGDLSQYKTKEEIKTALKTQRDNSSTHRNNAHALWQFANEIKPGDIVFVKKGMHTLVGCGIVESKYYYNDNREMYKHNCDMKWTHKGEWVHPGQAAMKTLTDITNYYGYPEKLLKIINNEQPIENKKEQNYDEDLILSPVEQGNKTQSLTIDQLAKIYKEEYENKVNENEDRKSDEYRTSTLARWCFAYDYAEDILSLSKTRSKNSIAEVCNKILEPTLGSYKAANMEIAAIIKLFNPKNQQQKSDNVFAKNYQIETPLVPACNVIYTGIPGCGKSYRIDNFDFVGEEKYNKWLKDGNSDAINGIKKNKDGKTIVYHADRVLFYPDYSYSDFVGQIIPKKVGEKIDYPFVPGPFTKALEYAFVHKNENCVLVIEEINRGNAAAIFGDVFQLLDRKEDGESEYKITNENICTYLKQNSNIDKNLFDGEKIYLPKNLSLVATMNTTDQNLYVLDSAFTRRWKKVLVANDFSKNKKLLPLEKFYITWGKFAEKTNEILRKKLKGFGNEDKQLGAYFVHSCLIEAKANYDADLKDEFANKVIQYLWSDVLKHNNRNIVFNPEIKTLEQAIDCFKQEDINKLFVEDLADVFEQTTQKETPNEQ